MKKGKNRILLLILVGIIGAASFIYLGYLIAGVIEQASTIGVLNSILSVASEPFLNYMNDYAPITMLLCFIIFETGYAYCILHTRPVEETDEVEEFQPDIINLVDLPDEKEEVVETESTDVELFRLSERKATSDDANVDERKKKKRLVSLPSKADTEEETEKTDRTIDEPSTDEKLSFGSEIMDEMLGSHYTLDQMVAMINIKKYMKEVNADLLMRMFKPDMTPEEISSYISLFYE